MRLQDNPHLPAQLAPLVRQLDTLYRQIATQVNGVTEGRLSAITNAATSPPTTGKWSVGDFIRNSAPAPTGSPEYIVIGWTCVADGEPGTWVESRALTGN